MNGQSAQAFQINSVESTQTSSTRLCFRARRLEAKNTFAAHGRGCWANVLCAPPYLHKDREVAQLPNEIHCAHILVNSDKDARMVLDRLNRGEKFSKIAGEVSLCPSRKRGGDLGTFGRGRMVKEFEQAAFALQKGQISSIVKTAFGYHIIKRLE